MDEDALNVLLAEGVDLPTALAGSATPPTAMPTPVWDAPHAVAARGRVWWFWLGALLGVLVSLLWALGQK